MITGGRNMTDKLLKETLTWVKVQNFQSPEL